MLLSQSHSRTSLRSTSPNFNNRREGKPPKSPRGREPAKLQDNQSTAMRKKEVFSTRSAVSQSRINTNSKIKALLRIRPFLIHQSLSTPIQLSAQNKSSISVVQDYHSYSFKFHNICDSEKKQVEVYHQIQNIVPTFLQGTSSTVFAYGQTGSGKTFTILGNMMDNNNTAQQQEIIDPSQSIGLLPRIISDIFRLSREMSSKKFDNM